MFLCNLIRIKLNMRKCSHIKLALEATQFENKINHQKKHKKLIKNNRLILKSQQKIRSKKHNVFTGEVNKIAVSANDDKIIQSLHSVETYAYGTTKDLVCKKEEIKCNNIIKKNAKMVNFHNVTKEKTKEYNRNWQQIPSEVQDLEK